MTSYVRIRRASLNTCISNVTSKWASHDQASKNVTSQIVQKCTRKITQELIHDRHIYIYTTPAWTATCQYGTCQCPSKMRIWVVPNTWVLFVGLYVFICHLHPLYDPILHLKSCNVRPSLPFTYRQLTRNGLLAKYAIKRNCLPLSFPASIRLFPRRWELRRRM